MGIHLTQNLTLNLYNDIIRIWDEVDLPYKPKGRDSFVNLQQRLKHTPTWIMFSVKSDPKQIKIETSPDEIDNFLPLQGVVIVSHDGQRGWINRLAVGKSFQRMGIASLLVEKSEEFLRTQQIYLFAALIEDDNRTSKLLFSKLKFTEHQDIIYFSKRDFPDI